MTPQFRMGINAQFKGIKMFTNWIELNDDLHAYCHTGDLSKSAVLVLVIPVKNHFYAKLLASVLNNNPKLSTQLLCLPATPNA